MTKAIDALWRELLRAAEATSLPVKHDGDEDLLDTIAGTIELRTYAAGGHDVARALAKIVRTLRARQTPQTEETAEAVRVGLIYGMPVRTARGRWTVSPWASMVDAWRAQELPQVDEEGPGEALATLGRASLARRPA